MASNDDLDRQNKIRELKRIRRERKRRRALIIKTITFLALLAILIVCVLVITGVFKKHAGGGTTDSIGTTSTAAGDSTAASSGTISGTSSAASGTTSTGTASTATTSTAPAGSKEEALASAEALAKTYDYDGAIAKIQSFSGYESDADLKKAIDTYTADKASCKAVDVSTIPHIFFHSLINDNRGLIESKTCPASRVTANNGDMVTVGEFDNVIQAMYDAGYVLVNLHDIITISDSGVISKNKDIMLPDGKKAFVMSEDDLSYYAQYGDNGAQGYADKLVIDDKGEVKCQFHDKDGNVQVGDYDVVPRFNTFVAEHPDFVYHGARPTIALTGMQGIFGYRTNDYYKEGVNGKDLSQVQKDWLTGHPDYDYDKDCAEAKKIAEALKKEGWSFASHTYLHLHANQASLDQIKADQERWKTCVGQFIGSTDMIIFAFGEDIGGAGSYDGNEKYNYYKSEGYNIYCNCDGNWGWTQYTENYARTGRFAVDGFTLYQATDPSAGSYKNCSKNYALMGVKDITSFLDPDRTLPINAD